jgi:hypothetical protein
VSAYVSLSADFKTITVDKANIALPADLGVHAFNIAINSANFPSTVATKNLPFNVDVKCVISSFTVGSKPADATYFLNDGSV